MERHRLHTISTQQFTDGLVPLEDERQIVRLIQGGDREALGTLYRWYGQRLYRVILRKLPIVELAEDVLRDTFRLALEKINLFKHEDRSIWFWLRRIAINRAIDVHRAHQRRRRLEEAISSEPLDRTHAAAPPAPDRGVDVDETRALVNEALEQLNPRYATALRLRLIEDRDREECARTMGVTVGNFDVILHRASKAFRKKYPPR